MLRDTFIASSLEMIPNQLTFGIGFHVNNINITYIRLFHQLGTLIL